MRKLIVLTFLLLLASRAAAEVRCTGTPCLDSAGGFTSPVTTTPVSATGVWTFDNAGNTPITAADGIAVPAAAAANAVQLGETAGCVTLEGATADAAEARVCGGDSTADGTLNLTSITTTGFRLSTASANINFAPAGFDTLSIEAAVTGSLRMRSTVLACWTNGLPEGPCDAVIGRNGLGGGLTIQSNVAGAIGFLSSAQLVQPQITTYTTTGPESGGMYTNTGDADGATITLLNDPVAGIWYDFAVTAAQTFTIQPSAGEQLFLLDTACASINSATVGGILHVVAATGGSGAIWVSQSTGAWTCTP